MPASKAFPNGMKMFPIFTVATTRLNAPVTAPAIEPIDTARSKAGKTDR